MRLDVALHDEDAVEDARDVGVENRRPLAEGEAADRAGGVGADALEREQRLLVAGSAPPYRSTDSRAMACSRRGRML